MTIVPRVMSVALLPFLALAIGVAVGSIIAPEGSKNQSAESAMINTHDRQVLLQLSTKIDGIEGTLHDIEQRLEHLVVSSATPAIDRGNERTPVGQAPDPSAAIGVGDETAPGGWLATLDPEIGGVLVERGLTPYARGIGKLVTRAGSLMREAQSEYDNAADPLKDQINANLADPRCKELHLQLAQLGLQLKHRRQAAIGQLIKELDAR